MKVKGHDGYSADNHRRPPVGKVIGHPQLASATARCGCCGTSTQLSGRPGTKVRDFKCRTCKQINLANGDAGFTFASMN